ncbi:MAG: DUF4190 domain-containing protein [Microbacterium sp.]
MSYPGDKQNTQQGYPQQQPYGSAPQLYGGTAYPYPVAPPTDGFAITSLVLALCGLAILPVIFGHVALSRIKQNGTGGRGLALAGLIIGYVEIGFWLLLIAFCVIIVGTAGTLSTIGS